MREGFRMSLGFGAQQSIVRGPLGGWVGWGKEGGWRGERKALFCSVSWSALLWEVCGQWGGALSFDSTVSTPGVPPADPWADPTVDLPGDPCSRHPV